MSSSCGHSHHSGMAAPWRSCQALGSNFQDNISPSLYVPHIISCRTTKVWGVWYASSFQASPNQLPQATKNQVPLSPQNKPSRPRFMLQLSRTPQPRAYIICQSQEQKPLWPHVLSFSCGKKQSGHCHAWLPTLAACPGPGPVLVDLGVSGFTSDNKTGTNDAVDLAWTSDEARQKEITRVKPWWEKID